MAQKTFKWKLIKSMLLCSDCPSLANKIACTTRNSILGWEMIAASKNEFLRLFRSFESPSQPWSISNVSNIFKIHHDGSFIAQIEQKTRVSTKKCWMVKNVSPSGQLGRVRIECWEETKKNQINSFRLKNVWKKTQRQVNREIYELNWNIWAATLFICWILFRFDSFENRNDVFYCLNDWQDELWDIDSEFLISLPPFRWSLEGESTLRGIDPARNLENQSAVG